MEQIKRLINSVGKRCSAHHTLVHTTVSAIPKVLTDAVVNFIIDAMILTFLTIMISALVKLFLGYFFLLVQHELLKTYDVYLFDIGYGFFLIDIEAIGCYTAAEFGEIHVLIILFVA